jgi:hypothetical protein
MDSNQAEIALIAQNLANSHYPESRRYNQILGRLRLIRPNSGWNY